MTQFESLANELLIDVFEFFDTCQLLHTFRNLNHRFDQLLRIHFRLHSFNFQSISKEDFDHVCQKHLPLIIDQIVVLRLSNDETPNLPKLLLIHGFTLDRFIHLRSLSLYKINSLDALINITSQCQYLRYLTHFTMHHCCISWWRDDAGFIVFNNIYNISTLIHCSLSNIQTTAIRFKDTLTTSSSMQYLSMKNIPCNLHTLSNLLQCTSNLQQLCININSLYTDEYLNLIMPSIISLTLSFQGSYDVMKNIFQIMPNLCYLTIDTPDICLNGHQWEEIISNYLPELKVLKFKMNMHLFRYENKEKKADELLNTFRSIFWLVDHQWFVQCYWDPSGSYGPITIYTLPYAFDTFDYSDEYHFKSTCIDTAVYHRYDRVEYFSYYPQGSINNAFPFFFARFSNIRHLNIELPWNTRIDLHKVTLNQLKSINVKITNEFGYSQLQTIFDGAPRLYSLKVNSFDKFKTGLRELTSKSIRRIDFIDDTCYSSKCFTGKASITFFNSHLILQCEILLIHIEDRSNVLIIIQNMSRLRSLTFRCTDDERTYWETEHTELNPVRWLRNRFPSTYSIIRHQEYSFFVQVWIDRQTKTWNNRPLISRGKRIISQFLTVFQQHYVRIKREFIMPIYRTDNE